MTRIWDMAKPSSDAPSHARVHPLTAAVLAARGIGGDAPSLAFLNPTLRHLHDPSLMYDMDRAAERLLAAAKSGEAIVIYGDYDVDGVCAAAIVFHMLRAIAPGANVQTYVPHRVDEGYGLSTQAIEQLAADGARVIVSVDCGVTAVEPALAAERAGVDLIITDHHNLPDDPADLPRAYAVVHPRHPLGSYPFGDLCGAGVAFKLAWRMATMHADSDRVGDNIRALLLELLALASLGVVADVVPLLGENRVMARHGLACIRASANPGLRALVETSGLAKETIDATRVGFILGPRLNACGRMGHAREAVELLTTAQGPRAVEIARELTRLNDQRRAIEQAMTQLAAELAEARGMTGPDRRAIVLAHEDWHPGVVGIACARLVERFGRPVILMKRTDDVCAGSGRSIPGLSLHAALSECDRWLESFGGHDYAAGLRLPTRHLDDFTEAFTECVNRAIAVEDLGQHLRIDCDAALSDLTPAAMREIDQLAPFGRDNPPVTVALRDVVVVGQPKRFGREGGHLALHVKQGDRVMRLVGWNWGERADAFWAGCRLDAAVTPVVSRWNGSERIEPEIQDLRRLDA